MCQLIINLLFFKALWRWLFALAHGVDKNDRQTIYFAISDILYCEDEESLAIAKAKLESLPCFKKNKLLKK